MAPGGALASCRDEGSNAERFGGPLQWTVEGQQRLPETLCASEMDSVGKFQSKIEALNELGTGTYVAVFDDWRDAYPMKPCVEIGEPGSGLAGRQSPSSDETRKRRNCFTSRK